MYFFKLIGAFIVMSETKKMKVLGVYYTNVNAVHLLYIKIEISCVMDLKNNVMFNLYH
jgi:hypothetical protein